ncbi:MAG: succinylglutamate desuccinylase/aspartoacylase family protein [Acidimicrobiia bacterium]|nr:succinylglutamate desuccinylase/aspartoacylase family protein [Acidimicrobiia bacterium]
MLEVRNDPITIGDTTIPPGRKIRLELPFATLSTGSVASLPVAVINGRSTGPNVWISGAVHGDELNGVEIVRRVMRLLDAKKLRGAVIAVPIVNPLGFIHESRYLPDRRDLNRSFPGSPRGSSASRLAHLFMTEIVAQSVVGIDCHTATGNRINVPQIRTDTDDPETLKLARAFGTQFTIHARLRDGSLREAATSRGIKVLLLEAGQAHRFDDFAIKSGVNGIMRTLRSLNMIDARLPQGKKTEVIRKTRWVRARRGGLATVLPKLGERVEAGQVVAEISDAFGYRPAPVKASATGWIIGKTQAPQVNPGDALVNIGVDDSI